MSIYCNKISAFTRQGNKSPNQPNHYNEDTLVVGERIFAVIDGATALIPADMDGVNPSAYCARFIARFLRRADSDMTDPRDAEALLYAVNEAFIQDIKQNWPEIYAAGKLGPCAAVAIVKLHPKQNQISYANISDSPIVMLDQKNIWQELSFSAPQHESYDRILTEIMHKSRLAKRDGSDDNSTTTDASALSATSSTRPDDPARKQVEIARSHMNIDHGVFAAEPINPQFVKAGTLPWQEARKIVLFSDGFLTSDHLVETPHPTLSAFSTPAGAAAQLGLLGLEGAYKAICDLYAQDIDMLHYPRLKYQDDSTALMLDF